MVNSLFAQISDVSPALLKQWGIPVLIFVAVTAAVWLVARMVVRRPRSEEEPDEGLFGGLTPALAAQLPESEKEQRDFRLLMRQAGLYRSAARTTIYALRFVLLLVPLVVAGTWAALADTQHTWKILGLGILVAAGLSVLPRLYVFFRRRRRMARIREGLPDTIDMLSMCLSGGLPLNESLQHVTRQTAYRELAEELTILRRQTEVGNLRQALADFALRVDLPEVRQLSNLLLRGSVLGNELSGSLNKQADHLRTARKQAATALANKVPVKLVLPLMFCFAPAALILLTAPAILELRDFMVPPASSQAAAREGFGSGAVVRSVRGLRSPSAPVVAAPDVETSPGR